MSPPLEERLQTDWKSRKCLLLCVSLVVTLPLEGRCDKSQLELLQSRVGGTAAGPFVGWGEDRRGSCATDSVTLSHLPHGSRRNVSRV